MKDYLFKATAFNNEIRVYAINATNTVQTAFERHGLWPTATAALGRTLVVGAMMGSMLKGKENLRIKIQGDGPIGEVVVDANSFGEVRGYVGNPKVHFQYPNGKLDVSSAIGKNGEIRVIKDLGMKEYFTSSVDIISGEIGEDFTYYFTKSEQTPSSVGCGVLVNTDNSVLAAGGFIIQVMPGAKDETIIKLEESLSKITSVSDMIYKGYTPEDIIKELCGENNYNILAKTDVKFVCDCTKESFARGLVSLGKKDLRMIIDEDKQAEIVCHFCNEKYLFSEEELEEIYKNI